MNGADLAVADGMPLVWLSRFKGQPLSERVAGVELVTRAAGSPRTRARVCFCSARAGGVPSPRPNGCEVDVPGPADRGPYSPPMGPLDAAAESSTSSA